MTHDELLTEIDDYIYKHGLAGLKTSVFFALRAVVELHKPCNCDVSHCDYCTDLGDMFSNQPYPCPTIQAIEKELM